MRPAAQSEIDRIAATTHTDHTDVYARLRADRGTWYHVGINETGTPGNLDDQRQALEDEGAESGHLIETVVLPGHRDGGFFAIMP
ncbi:MAG TPA: hypothetical protein VGS10_11380 [Terracidiphilus sp.]|nr:hypothetical protein [Terracidiphilus sp.]